MYTVDLYLRVRLACHVDGLSQREAASRFGIARETVRKMLRHSEPPGYRRRQPPKRPKLAPFTDIIDRILEEDRPVHRKQHHTAKRIFERLRDEHGFTGKETIVKDYVRERRLRRREMFVPLSHPPGHAQADFGEADAIIAGVKYRAHFVVMTLPHSDACFVAAYPAATTEAWLDGHNRAFVFFGGVPQSILYDNDKCLVSRILSDGTRQRTRAFSGLQSHYLFEDRYGFVAGKGNDKGNVEGVVRLCPAELHDCRGFPGSRAGTPSMATWKSNAATGHDASPICFADDRLHAAEALEVEGLRRRSTLGGFHPPQRLPRPGRRRRSSCPEAEHELLPGPWSRGGWPLHPGGLHPGRVDPRIDDLVQMGMSPSP